MLPEDRSGTTPGAPTGLTWERHRSVVAQALEAVRERWEQREMAPNDAPEPHAPRKHQPRLRGAANPFECMMLNGGADGARTRDLRRDRPAL